MRRRKGQGKGRKDPEENGEGDHAALRVGSRNVEGRDREVGCCMLNIEKMMMLNIGRSDQKRAKG